MSRRLSMDEQFSVLRALAEGDSFEAGALFAFDPDGAISGRCVKVLEQDGERALVMVDLRYRGVHLMTLEAALRESPGKVVWRRLDHVVS